MGSPKEGVKQFSIRFRTILFKVQGEKYVPPPPSPDFWPQSIFQGRGVQLHWWKRTEGGGNGISRKKPCQKSAWYVRFLRHVMRAISSVWPKCSHRCVSLKESPLKPVLIPKHATRMSTEQTERNGLNISRFKLLRRISYHVIFQQMSVDVATTFHKKRQKLGMLSEILTRCHMKIRQISACDTPSARQSQKVLIRGVPRSGRLDLSSTTSSLSRTYWSRDATFVDKHRNNRK